MKQHLLYGLLFVLSGYANAQSQLFISEYSERTSNNKAIEIYNGAAQSINLTIQEYVLQYYYNGSTTPGLNINLEGIVGPGDVFVIAHTLADCLILEQADQINGAG